MQVPSKSSLLLLPFLLLIAFVGTSRVFALSIGAALDTDSKIGKQQKIAIQVAVGRFNASSQPLRLGIIELESSNTLQSSNAIHDLIQGGAEVIISTGTWPQVLTISDISRRTNIPTISLTPSSTGFSTPLLVDMSYSDEPLVKCLTSFVASFKWRRVTLLYEDDKYGTVSGTALLLVRELQKVGTQVDYTAVFPSIDSISDLKSTVRAELHRMNQHTATVYIILKGSENLTLTLFQEATTLGMMEQGSSWICGPDVATLLDSTFNSFILNYMQGVISIEPYINESKSEYITFCSDFQKAYKSEYEKSGETVFSPGVSGARAYDAVKAVSFAANRAKVNNNFLVNELLSINFMGLSGHVKPILGNLKEASDYSAFRVLNAVGKSYKEIGFWLDGFGFYNDESQLNLQRSAVVPRLSVAFWPGGTRITPGGLKRLKIGIPANPTWNGFIEVEYDNRTENVKSISGFCIDVFIEAVNRLNSQILYEFVPFTIGSNFTYDDLVDQVYLKNIDIAVGDITSASYRAEKVTFTAPFVSLGLAMIIPMKRDNISLMLMKPFTPLLWVTIFTLLFYNFGIVWYLERHHEKADEDFNGPWYRQIGATFWIIGNTVFQSYGDKVGNLYTKTVIISWLLVVLIVSNCFTANLSSILVTEKLKPVIDKSIAGCDGASFVVSYLKNVLNFKPEKIVQIKNQEDYPVAFENGIITAAFIESPYVRVFLSKHDNYAVYGEIHMLGGFAFVLQKGDPMASDLSKEVLSLAEDGTIKQLESKWFSVSLSNFGTTTNNIDRQSLGLEVFWSLLVFSFGTSFTTLVTYLIQKRSTENKKKKEQRIAPGWEEGETMQVSRIEEDHVRLDVHNKTAVLIVDPIID